MNIRRALLSILAVGVVLTAAFSLQAGPRRNRQSGGEEIIVVGRLVDLQSFMTGRHPGGDPKRASQQAIRSGVPAALETEDGMIVVGMGERGPARILSPLALQQVELKGKLFEKEGLEYLDLISARAVQMEGDEVEHAEPTEPHDYVDEQPEEESPEEAPPPDEEP